MIEPPLFPDNPIPSWEEFTEDYNLEFFDDLHPDQGRSYIIEAEGTDVGHINYNEIDRESNSVELDIWLAGSKYCNKGYGTEAILVLCQYLADHLGCRTFFLAPSARNKAAIRAYEKCRFQVAKELPRNFVPDYEDSVVMMKKLGENL